MNPTHTNQQNTRLLDALTSENSSTRLQAAQAAGTHPDPALADALLARCAVESDFFVRETLTWALTRLPAEITVPRLVAALRSERAQARSQALHTLSKIGDRSAWPAITPALLHDADDEVARSAWRAAVALVPDGEQRALAEELAAELGRGDRTTRLSLSRALTALADVIEPALRGGLASADPTVRAHADATQRLLHDPEAAYDEGRRIVALGSHQVEGTTC
jgi:HEAT repeat protein